jgi:hypothetical protein
MMAKSAGETPHLSVVIVVVTDAGHLAGCLSALSQQAHPPVMEIIVPYDGRDQGIASLHARFREVRFHPVHNLQSATGSPGSSHEHLDEFRALGLGLARGEIVALLEDHDRPDQHWSSSILEAHRQCQAAAIGGAIENEVDRPLNWAIYFCDFGRYQNPVKPGPSATLSDVNISYKRHALAEIREAWEGFYHEPFVSERLLSQGKEQWISPQIVVYQHREGVRMGAAIRERYDWGHYYAKNRVQKLSRLRRIIYLVLSPTLPWLLIARKTRDVLRKKRLVSAFMRALPLTFFLTLCWSWGEFRGYLAAGHLNEQSKRK